MRRLQAWIQCIRTGHDWHTLTYSPEYNYQRCINCRNERRARRTW